MVTQTRVLDKLDASCRVVDLDSCDNCGHHSGQSVIVDVGGGRHVTLPVVDYVGQTDGEVFEKAATWVRQLYKKADDTLSDQQIEDLIATRDFGLRIYSLSPGITPEKRLGSDGYYYRLTMAIGLLFPRGPRFDAIRDAADRKMVEAARQGLECTGINTSGKDCPAHSHIRIGPAYPPIP